MTVLTLNNEQVSNLITVSECISVVEEVFKDLSISQMPPKVYMNIPNGDFRAMPAVVGNTAGIKWCGVHLDETGTKRKINIFAKVLINDINSGSLLAIMDGESITAIRTAAVTGLATKYICKEGASVASFVGCGNQTKFQIDAILAVRPIEKIKLFDLDKSRAEYMGTLFDVPFVVCESLEECVGDTDIVTTLTPSRTGFIKHEWLDKTVHINAIGADAEGKRELESSVLDNVDYVVYDNWEQCSHSGEIQYVAYDDRKQAWSSLGDIVSGGAAIFGKQTLFDATGLAIEDVAVGRYIYEKEISK